MATNYVVINNSHELSNSNFIFSNNENLFFSFIDDQSENSSSPSYNDLQYSLSMDDSPNSQSASVSYGPFLTIEEQPKDQLRFRYSSEKGFHGGLKPVIKLHGIENPDDIWIKATLYTSGNNPTLHVFELKGKQCKDGVGWQKISKELTAKFPALSICTKKKDEILDVLKKRIREEIKEMGKEINDKHLEKEAADRMKRFNLTSGKLCFEAFYQKNDKIPGCERIFSETIYNQKCTQAGELKITRLSSYSGKASGGEDMILLCDKIRKDDIEVIFSCQNQNMNWEEKAQFNPADVHHQVAIPFKTPRFIENIEQKVLIRLHRISDDKDGEARTFLYKPCDDFDCKPLKRKRPNPPEDFAESSQFQSVPSTSDGPLSEEEFETFKSLLDSVMKDDTEWNLPFPLDVDPVTIEGILNLASMNLSGNDSEVKKKDLKVKPTSCHKIDQIQMLKNEIIGLLQERGYDSFLRFLPALLSIKDEHGNSLLHLVVIEKSDNLNLLVKMIEAAPNNLINQTNKMQMTPLHIAVTKGLWKVIRILLMSGADPNIKDRDGNTCTHLAALYSLPRCLGEVLAPLLGAKGRKHIPAVDVLNYEGLSPLHLSIKNESKMCVKLLIEAKADINISEGKCGKTPFHFACDKNNSELVNLLISQPGFDYGAEDFNGNAPHSHLSKGHTNVKFVPKPTECCIELSSESSNSIEDDNNTEKEKSCDLEKNNAEEKHSDDNSEDLFCKTLDSNGLWKKLGLYVMDKKELDIIEEMDSAPSKTILNEIKEQHGENYHKKLKNILSDNELKEFAPLLNIKL